MRVDISIKEIMRKDVITVRPGDTIQHAANLMKKNKVGSVIIEGDPAGILTATDIVHKHVAHNKGKLVKDIMTKSLVRIPLNKTIEEAAKLMSEKDIEKLPVVEKDKIIGIITATDILKFEPALLEILMEETEVATGLERDQSESECESCGNYSGDVKEVNGRYLCSECILNLD